MTKRRVAVTGTGVICSLGDNVSSLFANLVAGRSGIRRMDDWAQYEGLKTLLGAPAVDYDSKTISRHARRTMSRMSEMALLASQQALRQADLTHINSLRTLICMGSTTGSPPTFEQYFRKYIERNGPTGQLSTSFFKIMNHSVASNVSVGLDFNGPQLAVASACATSTQAIVAGWELISAGFYDIVIAGGADELHHTSAAIFDNVAAASTKYNEQPDLSPRPFDVDRDGLVVSEGAGVVILESEEHMRKRGALPLAYIDGGAYYCNGTHMTQPQVEGMIDTMRKAFERSQRRPDEIDYVNAHGTGTLMGDIKEATATCELLGPEVPVSSIKGHLGHPLAACGSIELISCIEMMQQKLLIPTRNLRTVDPDIPSMNLLKEVRESQLKVALCNNFAFGGMNTSVIVSARNEVK